MVTRYASPSAVPILQQYGLPACPLPARSGGLEIELGDLPAGSLVVPSLAVLEREAPHRFVLLADRERAWPLPWVTHSRTVAAAKQIEPDGVECLIDCWLARDALGNARLRLETEAPLASLPTLLAVSARARDLHLPPQTAAVTRIAPATAISQHELRVPHPGAVCSAAATAMVLNAHGLPVRGEQIVAEVRDPTHRIYGIWPLALASAARRGCLGSIEAFSSLGAALDLCDRGIAVVCSVNFTSGALPGAAIDATGGHLVVLRGAPEPGRVLINDPAARVAAGVPCEVDADAFARAWLAERGVGYVILPPTRSQTNTQHRRRVSVTRTARGTGPPRNP